MIVIIETHLISCFFVVLLSFTEGWKEFISDYTTVHLASKSNINSLNSFLWGSESSLAHLLYGHGWRMKLQTQVTKAKFCLSSALEIGWKAETSRKSSVIQDLLLLHSFQPEFECWFRAGASAGALYKLAPAAVLFSYFLVNCKGKPAGSVY